MFVRVKTTPNSPRRSIQICENHRVKEKIKQKIVHYVGIAVDEREEEKLKNYAYERIAKFTVQRVQAARQQSFLPLQESDVLNHLKRGRKKQKKLEDILPPSEVSLDDVVEQARVIEGVKDVAGSVFDTLFPKISDMKKMTFLKTKSLFPKGIDVLLFDVTTLYFESTNTDDLRTFGYSKDHRFNTTQVVLALATNSDGLPIGYELFEGNRAEVKTLVAAIESWKTLFNISSVCFVGDRAMMSKDNLSLLDTLNYQYIIAAKLKTLPKNLQADILNERHYRPTLMGQSLTWMGEFTHQGQRLIVSYKSTRAMNDQKERQAVLDKIQKQMGTQGKAKKLITNQGVKKFITLNEDAQFTLNQENIEKAKQWDGLHGVISNIKADSPESLILRYAKLWKIEESFRINKHTLQMRPIFHFKAERIHAHIAICYMAFSVLRHLEYRVNLTQKMSVHSILEELLNVQASIYLHKKTFDRYRLPGYFTNQARKIYKTFGIQRSLDASIYLL